MLRLLFLGSLLSLGILVSWQSSGKGPTSRRASKTSSSAGSVSNQRQNLSPAVLQQGLLDEFVRANLGEVPRSVQEPLASPLQDLSDVGRYLDRATVQKIGEPVAISELKDPQLPAVAFLREQNKLALIVALSPESQEAYLVTAMDSAEWLSQADLKQKLAETCICSSAERPKTCQLWLPFGAFNAGRIRHNKEFSATLPLRNLASHDIEIKDALTSCGCTKIIDRPKRISARSFEVVKLHINPAKSMQEDLFQQTMVFEAAEPFRPQHTFKVLGKLYREIGMFPASIPVGDLSQQLGSRTFECLIYAPQIERAIVEPVELANGLALISSQPEAARSRMKLVWKLQPEQVSPRVDHRFISTALLRFKYFRNEDEPQEELLEFSLHGTKSPPISVWPGTLFFGRLRAGEEWRTTVAVQTRGTAIFKASCLDHFNVTLLPQANQLEVKIKAPQHIGYYKTNILLTAGDVSVNLPLMGYLEE